MEEGPCNFPRGRNPCYKVEQNCAQQREQTGSHHVLGRGVIHLPCSSQLSQALASVYTDVLPGAVNLQSEDRHGRTTLSQSIL